MNRFHGRGKRPQIIGLFKLAPLSGERLLLRRKVVHIVKEQTLFIHQIKLFSRLILWDALVKHFLIHSVCDSATRRSCAEAHVNLFPQFLPTDLQRTEDACQRNDAGALDIVVEHRIGIFVLVQDNGSVGTSEVLKVQVQMREHLFSSLYEPIDELIISVAANALMTISEIKRVIQQALPVRAYIQHHRQHFVGVDSGGCRVNSELSNGDLHTVGSPVADTENHLRVRHDDQIDLAPVCCIDQRFFDVLRVVDGQIRCVLRLNVELTVLFDGLRHHRIVDDGHELHDMLTE